MTRTEVEATMGVRRLGYVVIQSPESDGWVAFGEDQLGVEVTVEGDTHRLRIDEHAWRIAVEPGPEPRLLATGWEVDDLVSLRDTADRLGEAGHVVRWIEGPRAEARQVEQLVEVDDPSGNRLEIFHSPLLDISEVRLRSVSGYVTGSLGLGHVVLPAPDLDATFDFYTRLLGFRHRDTMRIRRPGDEHVFRMRFLGCNPRHHSLALAELAEPTGLRHLMLEMESLRDVGQAYDRARKVPGRLRTHLGQHSNDEMFSFYLYTPEGFAVEIGTSGRLVDDLTWSARELQQLSYWGYEFVGDR